MSDGPPLAATLPGTPMVVRFVHSPLGLPGGDNVTVVLPRAGTTRGTPDTDPPALLRWEGDRWAPVAWEPHMWWSRFAIAARAATLGTRYEAAGSWPAVSAHVRAWLESTTFTERARFFRGPDLRLLVRQALSGKRPAAPGAEEEADRRRRRRRLLDLLRVAQLVPAGVLEPIDITADAPAPGEEYSSRRTLRLVHQLCRSHPALGSGTMAYACTAEDLNALLMARYGASLAEVGAGSAAATPPSVGEALLPAAVKPPPHLARARVERHTDLGCAILRLRPADPGPLVASLEADLVWRNFAGAV